MIMTDTPLIEPGAALSEKIAYARSVDIEFSQLRDRARIVATNLPMTSEPVAFHSIRVVLEMMLVKANDRGNLLLAEAVAEALAGTNKAIEFQGISDYDRHEVFGSSYYIYSIGDLHVAPA